MNCRTIVAAVLLLLAGRVNAGKEPLSPEELVAESTLIVTGRVESRDEDDREHDDGSVTRFVTVAVRVEAVEKGSAKAGDVIRCRCWVVVREPRDGIVWDAGTGVPGNGGRLRFFLNGKTGDAWHVIYPNGLEPLDATPFVRYQREKFLPPALPPANETPWYWLFGGSVLLTLTAAGVMLYVVRKTGRSAENAPKDSV